MVKLLLPDQNQLDDIIADAKPFQSRESRDRLIERAGLLPIRSTLHLEFSTTQLIAHHLVSDLCGHGRKALGDFIGTLAQEIYDPESAALRFLHHILLTYQLPLPRYGYEINPIEQLEQLEHATSPAAFLPVTFLEDAIEASKAVALVKVPDKNRVGTSFLVGNSLLLTDHHVLEHQEDAEHAIFRFNYQATRDGQPTQFIDYRMKAGGLFTTDAAHDYSFVELEGTPGTQWGYLPLLESIVVKPFDRINIIQHPGGGRKQVVCTVDNVLVAIEPTQLVYTTATESGSSGAPVFTNEWQVVALHRAGVGVSDNNRPASRNRGTRIDTILHHLGNHPVRRLINN